MYPINGVNYNTPIIVSGESIRLSAYFHLHHSQIQKIESRQRNTAYRANVDYINKEKELEVVDRGIEPLCQD